MQSLYGQSQVPFTVTLIKPNNNSIKFKNRRANLRFFARYFKGPIALCLNKRLSEATELTSGGWRSCPAGVLSSTRPP